MTWLRQDFERNCIRAIKGITKITAQPALNTSGLRYLVLNAEKLS